MTKLTQLKKLLDAGLITQNDFDEKKKEILRIYMSSQNTTAKTLFIVWLSIAIGIGIIIFLVDYSNNFIFWGRFLWIEFLIVLVFSGLSGYLLSVFSKLNQNAIIGGVSLSIFIYAFCSFILVLIFWIFSQSDSVNKWHIILQILLILGLIFILAGLNISKTMASEQNLKTGIKTPDSFAIFCLLFKVIYKTNKQAQNLKILRENIKYSINLNANLENIDEYKNLISEILTLSKIYKTDENINDSIKNMILNVKLISKKQIRI